MPTEKPARASGVSAAEKYAELEARGEERPRCECHGEDRQWQKNCQLVQGGQWRRCAIFDRARCIRYHYANQEERKKKMRRWYAENAEDQKKKANERMAKWREDPNFRRRVTLYKMDYHHRRKHERWADQGLTLRNDGEEGSRGRSRAAA